ncbi:MAG TPA: glycosyltransferase, partial [Candidatus Saccharimonadales bacterium]
TTRAELAKDTLMILFVGRLEGRKGVKYLLRAFSLLSEHDGGGGGKAVRLVIAGDGPDREKLQALAATLRLKNVSFLGRVSDADKMALLHRADLFCSPAPYGESFGLVLLEAMACNIVTVAGDNSGYVSVMKELGALSLVNPRETADFARRLGLLLHEKALRSVWQKWAANYIKQFDYPAIIQQYEDLYVHTLKHHGHHIKVYEE